MKAANETPEIASTILLFLRAPQLGRVKTRLAESIGPQAALDTYRSLAEGQIDRLPQNWPLEIHFTPGDALAEMQQWLGDVHHYHPQVTGDLGARLETAVTRAFASGAQNVFCIGADCPALGAIHLQSAEQALQGGADLVFGPANDGGYYLVGMRKAETAAIFRDIPWSTSDTLQTSLETAKRLDLQVQLLEPLNDIDTVEELQHAVAQGLLPEWR
ncbi:MAG: DUF2064 domain-containing protein [Verrucomicrobia bacterium]|jgi:rSAM/selenodomain-associated transferase 1|nr:DUF2064 domain-containing protein [Verrucomicrobiota bacterium]